MSKTINILYFGAIAERTGKQNEEISVDMIKDRTIEAFVTATYPSLKDMSFTIAVDGMIGAELDTELSKEIALLPPFAGG